MPLWTTTYVSLYWSLGALLALACWRWGDRPTKLAGLIYYAGVGCGHLLLSNQDFAKFEGGAATMDLLLLIGLAWIAMRWPRWWWICLAAVQLASLLGHLSMLMNTGLSRLAYALMTGMGAYPSLMLIAVGLTTSIRNRSTQSRPPA